MQNLVENCTFNQVTCNINWEKKNNNGGNTSKEKDNLIPA